MLLGKHSMNNCYELWEGGGVVIIEFFLLIIYMFWAIVIILRGTFFLNKINNFGGMAGPPPPSVENSTEFINFFFETFPYVLINSSLGHIFS